MDGHMVIIDAHAHVGATFSTCYFVDRAYSGEELLEHMDVSGVSRAVVMAGGKPWELRERNRMVRDLALQAPDRIIPVYRVNPLVKDEVEKAREALEEHGFKGLKLHPAQDGYPANDPIIDPLLTLASSLKVPVIIHSGTIPYSMPAQIADAAIRYPDVPIIMAHAGKMELKEHAIDSASRAENIFLEFSFSIPLYVRKAIDAIGPYRVLFGSNWPAMSMRPWIETIKELSIFSDFEKECFLGRNAWELFRLSEE